MNVEVDLLSRPRFVVASHIIQRETLVIVLNKPRPLPSAPLQFHIDETCYPTTCR